MKRTSIGSWAYTIGPYADHPVDFDTVCTKLKELDFDGVELGGFPPHPNPDDLPEKSQRDEVNARLKELELGLSGLAANLWGEKLINTDDPSDYIEEFRKNAQFCEDLGIRGLRVDCVQPPDILDEVDYDTAIERVTGTWKTCCDIAADHGLYVTWEFEPGFAFNKPSDVIRIHDAVDKDNFGLQYDTCHAHMCSEVGARHHGEKEILPGGQIELLGMVSGRINHIHLIDSDDTCHKDEQGRDETSNHIPFGEGRINFEKVLPLLAREQLPHDWWTIDLCFWPNAWDVTARCKRSLDDYVVQYG